LRGRASEAFLRTAPLDSFSVFHFATHALVDETAVTRTALALSPGEGHDGFVGPGDLASLPLNADLVVLSACRTAGGELVEGEGIQGLTAPLLQAGARSVVATTWRIADATTGPFIEAFYRELASGHTVGAALRETKLAALRNGAPAAEWAAFVVVGDPLARVSLARPAERSAARFWIAALLVLAAAAYGLSRRKRPGAPVA
jgi:CHAT domain-containing protein